MLKEYFRSCCCLIVQEVRRCISHHKRFCVSPFGEHARKYSFIIAPKANFTQRRTGRETYPPPLLPYTCLGYRSSSGWARVRGTALCARGSNLVRGDNQHKAASTAPFTTTSPKANNTRRSTGRETYPPPLLSYPPSPHTHNTYSKLPSTYLEFGFVT